MFDRVFDGLEMFADFLEENAAIHTEVIDLLAEGSSHVLHDKAFKIYGDDSKLADLAPSTQAERERLGYDPNLPLYRDGELLRAHLERGSEGNLAGIGSAEPVQAYHEFGYINARTGNAVPPRPVMHEAMIESAPDIEALLHQAMGVMLGLSPRLTLKP